MPKIDFSCVPVETGKPCYPTQCQDAMANLKLRPVSRKSGLMQFAAVLASLAHKTKSSLRHWHVQHDEFVMATEGTLTVIEGDGAVKLDPAFPADVKNGHPLVKRAATRAALLVIDMQSETETAYHSNVVMTVKQQDGRFTFTPKIGEAITSEANRS